MEAYDKLLVQNKEWSEEKISQNPDFFRRLAEQQRPKFLWIGCSDSRVPADQITGTNPGEIFVHRNIANLVVQIDINMLSVLQYAVEVLEVEHIIVCGHYGCGGVKAALGHTNLGIINKWLGNIKEVYAMHEEELQGIHDIDKQTDRLVELNVIKQCVDLTKTNIVQGAWATRKAPTIHGWVYGLDTGRVTELYNITANIENVAPIFRFDNPVMKF